MDASTRPPQKRHQAPAHLALRLVAVLCLATPIHAATTNAIDPLSAEQKFIPAAAAHDVAITTVNVGQEALELSARFTENGTEIVQDVNWAIRNEAKEMVFSGRSSLADAALPPGDYQIEATYGSARIIQGLTLQQGTKVSVSFVLNAGGLRLLPRVQGLNIPALKSRTMIYALTGIARGQLVTSSHTAGEVIKISAGDYRIENQFENSNAIAITDVRVRPGIMSAVNINYVAGIARLSLGWVVQSTVNWTISDATSRVLFESATPAELVLKPGHYQAVANISGATYTTSFDLKTGETVDVVMPQK